MCWLSWAAAPCWCQPVQSVPLLLARVQPSPQPAHMCTQECRCFCLESPDRYCILVIPGQCHCDKPLLSTQEGLFPSLRLDLSLARGSSTGPALSLAWLPHLQVYLFMSFSMAPMAVGCSLLHPCEVGMCLSSLFYGTGTENQMFRFGRAHRQWPFCQE